MVAGERKLFGTDGIRGKANVPPMTPDTALALGRALARLARERGDGAAGEAAPLLIIAKDGRASGDMLEAAVAAGFASSGGDVGLAGLLPTPAVAYLVRRFGATMGVVVSASHNPADDNGLKVFGASGTKLSDEDEARVEELMAQTGGATIVEGGSAPGRIARSDQYAAEYVAELVTVVAGDGRLDGLRIVVDCANGAASEVAAEVFARLGATPIVLNAAPDGANINAACGALHPEQMAATVVRERAALGVAFDGDADRAIFAAADGEIVDGDHVLALLAGRLAAAGELDPPIVVGTTMSNFGLELALKQRRIRLLRADVGDRYVKELMDQTGARLGGEPSGHILVPALSIAGDGIVTTLAVCAAMRAAGGRSLRELVQDVPKVPQVIRNVAVARKIALAELPEVAAEIADAERRLSGIGRVVVRFSGTQPLARVMVEGADADLVAEIGDHLAAVVKAALGDATAAETRASE
ncbi:MAG: phosphoglucosamine mutase [Candidatus Schekmanbacteria bacterium]|nr:phosphoglucosamine mutase [Candidatus Schekmanbacteria bacterium]